MIPGFFAVGYYPPGWVPADLDNGTTDTFAALIAAGGDITYLMVADPYDPEAENELIALPGPVGWTAVGFPVTAYQGANVPVYLGDDHNYRSAPGDTPSNQLFDGVLTTAYDISANLGNPSDPLGGAEFSIGDVQINNGDARFDELVNRSWGGQEVTIYAGKESWPFSQFATVLKGTALQPRWDEAGINIGLRSAVALLEVPFSRSYYAGTGGAEGGADLANKPRPVVLGRCSSVPMVLLDTAKQIWQVAESLGEVLDVRDRGLAVDFSGNDYATYALLDAATVPAGEYATCLAEGLIRFGSDVTLPTADVDGPEAWGDTAAELAQYVAKNRLGPTLNFGAAQIDGGAFNRLDDARGYVLGAYIDGETTARAVIDYLMRSVGACVIPTRDGLLSCIYYELPTVGADTLTDADLDTAGMSSYARVRAVRRVNVGYRPNIRPLTETEMTETVSQADRLTLKSDFQLAASEEPTIDRDAVEIRIDTGIYAEEDAQELADALVALLSVHTHYYTWPLRGVPFRSWPGETRRVVYNRFGLSSGKNFIITGLTENSEGSSSLILWGPRGSTA